MAGGSPEKPCGRRVLTDKRPRRCIQRYGFEVKVGPQARLLTAVPRLPPPRRTRSSSMEASTSWSRRACSVW